MSDELSINLIQGAEVCSARMVHEFKKVVSSQVKSGDLSVELDTGKGWLTLSSMDMNLLDAVDKKAQSMLGYVPSV